MEVSATMKKTSSVVMDPRIWCKLPDELLERILSFLPLKTFLSLRSTCKRFKSLLFSPSFLSIHNSNNKNSPFSSSSFLLLSQPQSPHCLILYNTLLNAWRNFNLPSTLSSKNLLSISTSLLCFSLPNSSSFLIYNPLATSSHLIRFPHHPFPFLLPTLLATSSGYKIFCLSTSYTHVYDSTLSLWTQYPAFHRILTNTCPQQGVFFKDSLYFTTAHPFSVVGFDLGTGKWDTITEMSLGLGEELTFIRLGGGGGRLYMFGGIGRNGISRSMKVWELEGEGGRGWVEVGSVPEMMCRKLGGVCYHKYEHVGCFWHQEMVCVWCYTWPEVLYYRLSTRTWHWLPKCPSLPDKWSCGFKWFSFVPHLYAFV